jgi:hypothetical protein
VPMRRKMGPVMARISNTGLRGQKEAMPQCGKAPF